MLIDLGNTKVGMKIGILLQNLCGFHKINFGNDKRKIPTEEAPKDHIV
jgi:hypothetical protein